MKISVVGQTPLSLVPYLNASRGRQPVTELLPILLGRVSGLPTGIVGLVVTADLQGRERGPDGLPGRLLGELLAEHLEELASDGQLPPLDQMGALMAGDFLAVPELDSRGGIGDVSTVWQALSDRFRWVAGVLGNHDLLNGESDDAEPLPANARALDGEVVKLNGLRIGGIGGIIGRPTKENRKSEEDFLRTLEDVLRQQPAIVITHEGPACAPFEGNQTLGDAFESWAETCAESGRPAPLAVCGHTHWPTPVAELAHGMQVLNVDSRVVVLLGADWSDRLSP